MERALYIFARGLIAFLKSLPLRWVARIGRFVGGLSYFIDARHRRVATKNLASCFPEKSDRDIRALAFENFKRIGENFACSVKTAFMTREELRPHCDCIGAQKVRPPDPSPGPQSRILAVGHFGNFEIYARFNNYVPGFKHATTYRGLRQPSLNRLLQELRAQSGCLFFERRTDAAALKTAMSETGLMIGFLADQHAGNGGLRVPFFGRESSTSPAPAVFALRYNAPLYTAICYRVGLAQWRIEVGDEIPTVENDKRRDAEKIMLDVNRAFETAIRRDPANWFWVHNRWKPINRKAPQPRPVEQESLDQKTP